MIANLPAIVTTAGLMCDIVGAFFVAAELFAQFHGSPSTILPGSGAYGGSARAAKNPELESHERRISKFMVAGLVFLTAGFLLQIVGTWLPNWCASQAPVITSQAAAGIENPSRPAPSH